MVREALAVQEVEQAVQKHWINYDYSVWYSEEMQMAIEKKHLVISAIAGVIVAGFIIAGTILLPYIFGMITSINSTSEITSIPDENPPSITTPPPTEPSKTGMLALMLTDAPPRTLKYLYITIDEVRLRMANRTSEEYILNFPVTRTEYNVTKLKGDPVTLISSVPEGNYTAIWLHIVEAKATFANQNENVTLKIVAQGWLKIPIHTKVKSGELSMVVLDFDLEQTHVSASNVLTPVIRPKQVLGSS
jgi:hypothetical protein